MPATIASVVLSSSNASHAHSSRSFGDGSLNECDTRASVAAPCNMWNTRRRRASPNAVRCIWTLEGQADDLTAAAQPILPDGRPEIIVHLGDPFERVHGNRVRSARQPRTIFAGQLTSPLVVRPTGKDCGRRRSLSRRRRARADRLPAAPARRPDARLGDLSATLARQLHDACAAQPAVSQRGAGRGRLPAVGIWTSRGSIPDVRGAIAPIRRRTRRRIGWTTSATWTGVSRRHLERRFQEVVGLSPKRFARITRFQHALRIFEQGASRTSWRRHRRRMRLCGSGALHPRVQRARRLLTRSAPAEGCDAQQAFRMGGAPPADPRSAH